MRKNSKKLLVQNNKILPVTSQSQLLKVINYYCPPDFSHGARKFFLNTISGASTQSQAQAKTQSQAQAEAQAAAGTISSFVIIYDESQLIWQLTWS